MTHTKRHEWAEATRTALLCGVMASFIADSIPLELGTQFITAIAVAAASFA